jgi:lipoate-protein ligase A
VPWRLLDCTLGDPFQNIALEEAIFRELEEPTLRVWENQESVIIGRGQLARLETDIQQCRERGIPVVRRFTAGGAVFNGPGNINWSFFEPRPSGDRTGAFEAGKVFSRFAERVVDALRSQSVKAHFEPPNRIMNDVGKISGMAAYISASSVVCHGTLLTDADLQEAEELTRPSLVMTDKRYVRSVPTKIANCGLSKREFTDAMASVAAPGSTLDALRKDEVDITQTLLEGKYMKEAWNLGDPFALNDL